MASDAKRETPKRMRTPLLTQGYAFCQACDTAALRLLPASFDLAPGPEHKANDNCGLGVWNGPSNGVRCGWCGKRHYCCSNTRTVWGLSDGARTYCGL